MLFLLLILVFPTGSIHPAKSWKETMYLNVLETCWSSPQKALGEGQSVVIIRVCIKTFPRPPFFKIGLELQFPQLTCNPSFLFCPSGPCDYLQPMSVEPVVSGLQHLNCSPRAPLFFGVREWQCWK